MIPVLRNYVITRRGMCIGKVVQMIASSVRLEMPGKMYRCITELHREVVRRKWYVAVNVCTEDVGLKTFRAVYRQTKARTRKSCINNAMR
jgi:hypothetical protein